MGHIAIDNLLGVCLQQETPIRLEVRYAAVLFSQSRKAIFKAPTVKVSQSSFG